MDQIKKNIKKEKKYLNEVIPRTLPLIHINPAYKTEMKRMISRYRYLEEKEEVLEKFIGINKKKIQTLGNMLKMNYYTNGKYYEQQQQKRTLQKLK